MQTLLDPNFDFPDLVTVAEAMVAGTIYKKAAFALARKTTGGEIRQTSVGRALVIGSTAKAEKVLAALEAFEIAHGQRTVERWAAFSLMIEAQLGTNNIDPEVAPLALSNALDVFMPAVKATHDCPPEAVEFVVEAIDSILQNSACTDPALRTDLTKARAMFSARAK